MGKKAKAAAELEQLIQFRRKVNSGLLERIRQRVEEARLEPEPPGEGLEDLEEPEARKEDGC